ncbi:hypothetical protein [Pseudomonas sp. Gutcm_11s]|uniref:hypothetical protein n=1 Tax=Pseudomonas sp. Gutcm_11s TaxID=3026088 RepID=UPI00236252CB|nr:hypothetical protein [Pseudomonas sp. Gutcm_11s]MDD0841157.1 hypothetical protein [Pseudomonas sp. Gutcm_11s]
MPITIEPIKNIKYNKKRASRQEIYNCLTRVVIKLWSGESHRDISKKILELEKTEKITTKNALACWSNHPPIFKEESNSEVREKLLESYLCATLYSEHTRDWNELEINASLLNYALYHLGALEWQIELSEITKRNKKRASSGGKAKRKKSILAQEEIAKLLTSPPAGGWPSIEKTAEILRPKIENLIEEFELEKYTGDAFNFIKKEISGNSKSIYSEHKSKNNREIQGNH